MLRSRKLNPPPEIKLKRYEERPHSTSMQDMREKLRIENRLRKSQKPKGQGFSGIKNMIQRFGKSVNVTNSNAAANAKKMPRIFDTKLD